MGHAPHSLFENDEEPTAHPQSAGTHHTAAVKKIAHSGESESGTN